LGFGNPMSLSGKATMNQSMLNRAVARATGETVDRIHRMGFSLLIVPRCVRPPIGNYAKPRLKLFGATRQPAGNARVV
jgi:hypothetical protein